MTIYLVCDFDYKRMSRHVHHCVFYDLEVQNSVQCERVQVPL